MIRGKVYRIIAMAFAVVGLIVVAIVYVNKFDGKISHALQTPWFVMTLILPFVPAFVLSLMASSADKKLYKIYEEFEKNKAA